MSQGKTAVVPASLGVLGIQRGGGALMASKAKAAPPRASDEKEDHSLEKFFKENQYFFLPWVCLACVQLAVFQTPCIAAWCDRQGLEPLGAQSVIQMTVFAIMAQYVVHGALAVYHDSLVSQGLKIQDKPYIFRAEEVATRSSVLIMASMTAYALTPMNHGEASLLEIFIGYSILSLLHDAWFYMVHRAAHTQQLYALIHKTHHKWKQPMAFSAYFIRSPSQMLQEHACIIPCMVLLPVPVYSFLLYQYIGAPLSMLEHCGFRVGELTLPVLGLVNLPYFGYLKLEHLMTVLGGGLSLIFGSQTVEDHDYHHLNFHGNYALSFSYLDRIFGTYVEQSQSKSTADEALLKA
ncbi:unnamed protein product [Polarella glacialis]|uniref:Fatty acid hydroxylase domain-containing protein n=1 Tax=Polarella glacialis TaxID=89957 RepID=A0A813K7E9_POLGL|nr:unnamed protein product [Polarella glacialis]